MFIKKNLRFNNVNIIKEQIVWYLSFEIIVSKIPIIFAGVYLSADANNKPNVIESFDRWLECTLSAKQIVLCGDFNIDMISDSIYCRRLQNICEDNGLRLLTDSVTRVVERSATMIDLCFSNIMANNIKCTVLSDDQISDHSILEINVRGENKTAPNKIRSACVWSEYNVADLWQSLESALYSWRFVENATVNEKMEWLLNVINGAIQMH